MQNTRLGVRLFAASAALMASGLTPAHAATSHVSGHTANGGLYTSTPFSESSSVNPVQISITAPLGSGTFVRSQHYGASSAAQQTLRASADLRAQGSQIPEPDENGGGTAKTFASFSKETVAGAGISGLSLNAPTQLNVALRLEGTSQAGYFPVSLPLATEADFRLLASVDTFFRYRIVDLDSLICGEGCRPEVLVALNYSGSLIYDFKNNSSSGGTLDVTRDFIWSADTNNIAVPLRQSENTPEFLTDPALTIPDSRAINIDTGLLSLSFDTKVGHRLKIDASLDIFAQVDVTGFSARSMGDFAHSFDADLTGPAGMEFIGEIPGALPAPVPLPAGVWFFATGLFTLAYRYRRAGSQRRLD